MNYWKKSGIELALEINETRPEQNQLNYWFLGQLGLAVRYKNTLILVDPVLNDIKTETGESIRVYEPPFTPGEIKPDFVVCTHGHIDHMAKETMCGIAKSNPNVKFVIPQGCHAIALEYGISPSSIILCKDMEQIQLTDEISLKGLSAAHPKHYDAADDTRMALGYIFSFGNKIFAHLGDTFLTERLYKTLKSISKIDILMAPINGDDLFREMSDCIGNMEAEELAKLAVDLHVDLTIPAHFDMIKSNTVDPLRFAAKLRELDQSISYYIPVLGAKNIY